MNEQQRAELFEEYFRLSGFVQSYDSYFLTIKTWGVTVSGVAIGVGFSKDVINYNMQSEMFLIALALGTAFWWTEVRFKLIQLAHVTRQSVLERALQENVYIKAPALLESFSAESVIQRELGRWRRIVFWPHVMFPHIIFVVLSLILLTIKVVKHLAAS